MKPTELFTTKQLAEILDCCEIDQDELTDYLQYFFIEQDLPIPTDSDELIQFIIEKQTIYDMTQLDDELEALGL